MLAEKNRPVFILAGSEPHLCSMFVCVVCAWHGRQTGGDTAQPLKPTYYCASHRRGRSSSLQRIVKKSLKRKKRGLHPPSSFSSRSILQPLLYLPKVSAYDYDELARRDFVTKGPSYDEEKVQSSPAKKERSRGVKKNWNVFLSHHFFSLEQLGAEGVKGR